jgi:Secretion system C-terminal sorting domain
MRKIATAILTIAFLFVVTPALYAQVPNAGFENWTSGSPDGWDAASNITGYAVNITKSTDAHSGSSALRGDVVNLSGSYPPILWGGQMGNGFPYTGKDAAFTGYYKFVPVASSGDYLEIDVITFKNGWISGGLGYGTLKITAAATAYTKFTVPLVIVGSGTPDSCYALFTITNSGSSNGAVGSYFLIDDLSFGGATGVEEHGNIQPFVFSLNQNYPNPFNPSTIISYQVASTSMVSLKVYDMLGREAATLVNGVKAAGNYTATFNAANLPSGVYFYKLQAGNYTAMKKAILLR